MPRPAPALLNLEIRDVIKAADEFESLLAQLAARVGVHCAVAAMHMALCEGVARHEIDEATVSALDVAEIAHDRRLGVMPVSGTA